MSDEELSFQSLFNVPMPQNSNQNAIDNSNLELPPLVLLNNQHNQQTLDQHEENQPFFGVEQHGALNAPIQNNNRQRISELARRVAAGRRDLNHIRNQNLNIMENDTIDNLSRRSIPIQPNAIDSFDKFQFNNFQVRIEQGQMCIICNEIIQKIGVKDLNTQVKYHIECYNPPYKMQIRKCDFQYIVFKPEQKIYFQQTFLSKYNKQFYDIERFAQVEDIWINQLKIGEEKLQSNHMIEAFKFLQPKEVYSTCSIVSKQWYLTTWSKELQNYFLTKYWDSQTIERVQEEFSLQLKSEQCSEQKSLKASLISLISQSCFNCLVHMQIPEICPILKKPVCKNCRMIIPVDKPGISKYALLTHPQTIELFQFLEQDFGKNWIIDNKERLKLFDNGHQKLVYEHFINNFFHHKRQQRKIQILEVIEGLNISQNEKQLLYSLKTERMLTVKIDQNRRHVLKPILDLHYQTDKFQAVFSYIYKGNCDFQALIDFIGVKNTFLKKRKIK